MFEEKERNEFLEATTSLKQYSRIEPKDKKGKSIIDKLYTDPFPDNNILKICLQNRTTLLIGRKGTGKSTIFAKLEEEHRKTKESLTCYIDVFSTFESSKSSNYSNLNYLKGNYFSKENLSVYLLEREFIQNILKGIQKELEQRINEISSLNVLEKNKIKLINDKIVSLKDKIENNNMLKNIELPIIQEHHIKKNNDLMKETNKSNNINSGAKLGLNNESAVGISIDNNKNIKEHNFEGIEDDFSTIYLKVFRINEIIEEIQEILKKMNLKSLVIILDDVSEIDDISIKILNEVILVPLNNRSNNFINFKIAIYPERFYYGKLDNSKLDKIDLDFYKLYSLHKKESMEESAVDFTKRLIDTRIEYYTKKESEYFFDTSSNNMTDYYKLIFQMSMNIPRAIGWLLFYCHQTNILLNKKINTFSLQQASKKYYNDVINKELYDKTKFSTVAYKEKLSINQLKELQDKFINKFREDKINIGKNIIKGKSFENKNPYLSHFYIYPKHEKLLSTLELNSVITKYKEMKDKDNNLSYIYCMNYGACIENSLKWGYPHGSKHRKYFVERNFNFNALIDNFLEKTEKLICNSCKKEFPYNDLDKIEYYEMKCPSCKKGKVEKMIFSENDSLDKLKIESEENQLDKFLYDILLVIFQNNASMRAKEIGKELAVSYQSLISKIKKLEDKELLTHNLIKRNKAFALTLKARKIYFEKQTT